MRNERPLDAVERSILNADIAPGSRILLAVSGGADSVALAHAMHTLASSGVRSWSLRIGHVNHGLRGDVSDDDERFVSRFAAEMRVESASARSSLDQNASSEAAARAERYRLLERMLDDWPGDLIVTAHTEDDQAETILLNLLRGAGSVGLGGIPPRRGRLVRPFLGVSRESILEYIQRHRLPYRVDRSNTDPKFLRNRIRQEIIPALRSITRDPSRSLARSASIARLDARYLTLEASDAVTALRTTVTDGAVTADLNTWRCVHPALRAAVIRRLLEELLGSLRDISSAHIGVIESFLLSPHSGARLERQLPHGLSLAIHGNRMALWHGERPPQKPIDPVTLRVPGAIELLGGRLLASGLAESQTTDLARLLNVSGPWHALCDAGALGDELTVRSRRAGDRFRPLGVGGSRKVQDLFMDRKVPAAERDRIVIVENGEHIVWIPGFAIDERAAAIAGSDNVVHLSFVPVQGRK